MLATPEAPSPAFAARGQQRNAAKGHSVKGQVRAIAQQQCRPVLPVPGKSQGQRSNQPESGKSRQRVERPPVAPGAVEERSQRV